METPKHPIPAGSTITNPVGKSWVASRFIVIDDGVGQKRRCSFLDCGKEYARGTSHMILKRHWSRQHNDSFSEFTTMRISTRNTSPSNNNISNSDTSNNNNQTPRRTTITTNISNNNNDKSNNNSTAQGNKSSSNNTNNNTSSSGSSLLTPKKNPSKSKYTGDVYNNSVILINNKPITSNDKAQLDVKLVAKRLKEATSIHLALDIYSPKKGGKTYGIITAHSIGDTSEIKSVLLEYKHLPYPDDSQTIYEFLRLCFTRFNIREKIVSVASSHSDVISMAVHEVDKRFRLSKNFNFSTCHVKCFPQFVHLNVMDVFKSQEVMIENIRKIVSFTNSNTITIKPLEPNETISTTAPTTPDNNAGSTDNDATMTSENACSTNNINNTTTNNTTTSNNNENTTTTNHVCIGNLNLNHKVTGLKLPQDQRNMWNTTFNMIDTFYQHRAIIEHTIVYMQQNSFPDSNSVSIDWDRLYTLIQLIKPFFEVISKFATESYTPVSLVAVSIPHLMDHLSNSSWCYEDMILAAHSFKMSLEQYRQEFQSDLTVIAGLLDPRVKDSFVAPEGKDDARIMLTKKAELSGRVEHHAHYNYTDDSIWARMFEHKIYDELGDYLGSPREQGHTNSTAYWEAHKFVYPNLYNLAKTLACVQATSVPSERMFSAAEHIEKERKAQLESTNSKELMKSWAKYLEK